MKPYIGCIVQARLTSTRFPNKILSDLFGKTVLEHVIEACHGSKLVDKVVIAAPHKLGACLNEELFIGSENDVLDRYYQCSKKYGFDVIVRITSDCPLTSPYEIDRVLSRIINKDTRYVTNRPSMPDGFDVEAFTFSALEEAWIKAVDGYDREHVTPFIKQQTNNNPIFLDSPKLSLDEPEDLERIKQYVRWQADINHGWNRLICSQFPETHSYKS